MSPSATTARFSTTLTATEGGNTIRISAVDRAGNRTDRTRAFTYRPTASVGIALDPAAPRDAAGRLLSASADLAIAGVSSADAGSGLRVLAADGALAVQTLVDAGGAFHFTVPASEAGTAYRLEIVGPDGTVEGQLELAAVQDALPPEIVLDAPPPNATADAWLDIAGAAEGAVTVSVNGAAARLDAGRFDAVATLVPGTNGIEIVATDAVGNVAIQRVETVYDIDPPEILSAGVGRPDGAAGTIEVVVEARDASGIRQAAPYILTVGGVERRGFLRCDSATGLCRETLPPEPGALALVEVAVEDYAGNVSKRQE